MTDTKKVAKATIERPRPRAGFGFSYLDNKFLVIGGANRDHGHFDDFWFLKIEKREEKFVSGWKPVKDFLDLDPRTGLTVNYHQNIAYIFGGQNFVNNMHSDQFYKLKVDQWICELVLTKNAPKPRNSHSAVVDSQNKRLVIYGGANEEGCFGDLHFYYFEDDRWESAGQVTGQDPREMHTAHMYSQGKMLVIGGRTENGSQGKQIYEIDLETKTASLRKTLPFSICSHASVLIGSRLYICGGLSGEMFNEDLYEIDLEAGHIWHMNVSVFEDEEQANIVMPGRIAMGFDYDPVNECLVMFGGSKVMGETNDVVIIPIEDYQKRKMVTPYK